MGMSMNGLLNNRKGTTLVEILVVMVILLIGIMYVVTMFPAGFGVVRAAESQTIATKLAQAEVERWKNMPGNLPDGILPISVDYALSTPQDTVLNDQYPGPPFEGFTGDPDATQFAAGNTVNFRYVRNEIATIPIGSYFTTGGGAMYGSRYTLAFSPIEVFGPDSKGMYSGLSIKSGELLRRVGDADSYMYLRQGQYGIDYTLGDSGGNPAFYVYLGYDRNPNHVYKISYSYWIRNSNSDDFVLLSRADQDISPDPNGNWVPVEVTIPPGYSGYEVDEIESNTDSCARGFVQLKSGSQWTSDPYEFWLADRIMGVLAFNPNAKNRTEPNGRGGTRAVSARIDYRIYDPRIIREDRVIQGLNEDIDENGANDHTAVKMALRFILNAGPMDSNSDPASLSDGDPTDNPDEPTFEGLIRKSLGRKVVSQDDLLVWDSMLIVDLATGLRVSMAGVSIDFGAGVVHLPPNADLLAWSGVPLSGTTSVPLKGRHLRFFYRADGDWSVQVQKAYTFYLREQDTSQVDYRHFKLRAPAGGPYQLLFARCDSGKNVTVDYSYIDEDGALHKVVGRTFRTSDDSITNLGVDCCYVTLAVPPNCEVGSGSRIVVSGASFRARVVWRDGKHWRHVDIDTNLTRNSTQ